MDFWDFVKKRKIKNLEEILKSDCLGDKSKTLLSEMLSQYYFKLGTGLYLSPKYQEQLLDIYRKNNSPVAFVHFKRAINYIQYDQNGNISHVKINFLEELLGCIIFVYIGIMSFFACIFLYVQHPVIIATSPLINFFCTVLIFSFLFIVGIFSTFFLYIKYKSCVYVNRQIGSNSDVCIYQASLKLKWGKFNMGRFIYYIVILSPMTPMICTMM